MQFNIEVINNKPQKIDGIPSYKGLLTIDDFEECFYMPFDSWSLEDYQKQWKEGIARLKTHDQSCLVTSVYKLKTKSAIEWWVLYKEGDMVFIQNHWFGKGIMQKRVPGNTKFDIHTCYLYIPERETVDDEGNKISEWSIGLADMLAYLEK